MKYYNKSSFSTPHEVLQKVYGYSEFRTGQLDIISNILNEKDCLAILPTGGGKSICFQVPGLLFNGITIIVSPLISLMKDQVDSLVSKGVSACYINSSLEDNKKKAIYKLVELQKFKFIYVAPERLLVPKFQKIIRRIPISLLVIDEAHCISQWGNDFRKSYKQIAIFYKYLPKNCVKVAVTATASKKVQNDIIASLSLSNPFIFYQSFKRTNLYLEHTHCNSEGIKNLVLLRLIQKHSNQTGIIYCATTKGVEKLSYFLNSLHIHNTFYHGKLKKEKKNLVQTEFISGTTKIIIATNAFGMGIDKDNIRFVVHYHIPGNIENYYQEVGRAGRDMKPASCYLLYCKKDLKIQNFLLSNNKNKLKKFRYMKTFVNKNICKTRMILDYFGEESAKCNNCNVCLETSIQKKGKQLLIHATRKEKQIIEKLISTKKLAKNKDKDLNNFYPLANTVIAYIAVLKPQTKQEMSSIPGIGNGLVLYWYQHIQHLIA